MPEANIVTNTGTVFRLTDKETGITVVAQNHRERQRNIKDALERMAVKLVDYHYGQEDKERSPAKEVIRTYNECENRVTNHRTGNKYSYKNFSLDKDIKNDR